MAPFKTKVPAPDLARIPVVFAVAPERVPVPDATFTVPVPAALMLMALLGLIVSFNARVVPLAMVNVPEPMPLLLLRVICPTERVVPFE